MEQSRDNVAISFCWDQVLDKCKAGSSGIIVIKTISGFDIYTKIVNFWSMIGDHILKYDVQFA